MNKIVPNDILLYTHYQLFTQSFSERLLPAANGGRYSYPQVELREPSGGEQGRTVRATTFRSQGTQSTKPNKQGSCGLTETELVITEPTWVYSRPSENMFGCLACALCGTPNTVCCDISDCFTWSLDPFPLTG